MIFIIDPFVANLLSLAVNRLTPSVSNVTKNIGVAIRDNYYL